MRIVCMGATAQEIIDGVKAREAMTANTSDNIMAYFNSHGGNTPLPAKTYASKSEQASSDGNGILNTITGIFGKLASIASPAPSVYTVKPAPVPYAGFAMVALAGLLIYKVAK